MIVDAMVDPGFATINVAYIALTAAAFSQRINRVRVLLVTGAAFFVGYGLIVGTLSMVIWNAVIGGLNFQRLVVGVWSEAQVSLTGQQQALRRQLFADLEPAEFQQLWELGADVLCADELLVESGVRQERLYLLLRGSVHIERDGAVLAVLHPGAVIGQLDPAPFSSPSADWRADGAVWLRAWDLADLADPSAHRPALWFLGRGDRPVAGAVA